MTNPNSNYKTCPLCARECEKYIMFHTTWYWRCKHCKIDADNPPKTSVKETKSNQNYPWDGEVTTPSYKNPFAMCTREFNVVDVKMPVISINSNFNPNSSMSQADVKISVQGRKDGLLYNETFQEVFDVTYGTTDQEDEMWEVISRSILHMPMAFSMDEIKIEYLKLRLSQRYPNDKIVVI